MPELPHLSGAEIIRILEKIGFATVRQRGSNVVMRRGGAGCVVPMHREVKRGTLAGILKQAGIDPQSFIEILRR
jgi:predicted RNA binding protein YcfA (HicA-like mRNA interferase family)